MPKPGEFFVVSSQNSALAGQQQQATAVNRLHKKIRDAHEIDGMIAQSMPSLPKYQKMAGNRANPNHTTGNQRMVRNRSVGQNLGLHEPGRVTYTEGVTV